MILSYLKHIVLFICFLFLTISGYSQRDLIITQAGEEIRCKILDETPTRFIYAYIGPKDKVLRNEIFKNLVGSFKYGHYSTDLLKNDKLTTKPTISAASPRIDTRKSETKSPAKKDIKRNEVEKKSEEIKIAPQNEKNSSKIENKDNPSKMNSSNLPSKEVKKENFQNIENEKEANIENKSSKKDSSTLNAILGNTKAPPKDNSKKANKENRNHEEKIAESSKIPDKESELKKEISKKEASPLADPEIKSEFKNYMKFRVGVKGGLGNIIQKNSDISPYGLFKEKLQRGWMFGVDAAFFVNDHFGFGATYTNFQANNSSKKLDYQNLFTGEAIKDGELETKVSHKFVGPTFLYRKAIDFKTFAVLTLSPGMHLYTDKGVTNAANYKFNGQAYGAAATLGLDFLLGNDIFGRDIILSLEGGYNYGQITTLNRGDNLGNITLPTPINLNRLDFTIGLRFTRFPMYLR